MSHCTRPPHISRCMRPLPVPGYGLIRMTGPLRWAALLLEKVCVQAEDKQTGLKLQPQLIATCASWLMSAEACCTRVFPVIVDDLSYLAAATIATTEIPLGLIDNYNRRHWTARLFDIAEAVGRKLIRRSCVGLHPSTAVVHPTRSSYARLCRLIVKATAAAAAARTTSTTARLLRSV